MLSLASTQGIAPIRASAGSFLDAFVRRIEEGLFGATASRSRYVVTHVAPDRLRFRAVDRLTALNVGLNEVELSVAADHVHYVVAYPRWAAYTIALCAGVGLVLMVVFVTVDLRSYLARQPGSLAMTPDHGVALAWGMAIFWGFVWPWVLIALHRRPLRTLMDRLIAETDAAAVDA